MSHQQYPDKSQDAVTESTVLQALEAAPLISIPANFAERVAQLALHQQGFPGYLFPHQAAKRGGVTPFVACISASLLLVALFVFAPHLKPSFLDLRFDLELMLLAELGGVGYLLARFSMR